MVVMVLLSVALVIGTWAMVRGRDRAIGAEPVDLSPAVRSGATTSGDPQAHTPTPTGPPHSEASATGPTRSDPAAMVTVHVIGAVRRPGLVRLPVGARVADAITAAGGLLDSAVPGRLNLAQPLRDGEQVFVSDSATVPSEVVGAGGEGDGGGGEPTGTAAPVNLNTATQAELESLPGVGPATAQAILAWRREHGRFTQVAELQEIDGIGPKTYARLAPLVTV